MGERRGTGNDNQHALNRGFKLSVLILKSCGIFFVLEASPFPWGLFDLREEASLASPAFATRVRLGAFGYPPSCVGTRSTPRLLRTIIALFILIRRWEVVRVGEGHRYSQVCRASSCEEPETTGIVDQWRGRLGTWERRTRSM